MVSLLSITSIHHITNKQTSIRELKGVKEMGIFFDEQPLLLKTSQFSTSLSPLKLFWWAQGAVLSSDVDDWVDLHVKPHANNNTRCKQKKCTETKRGKIPTSWSSFGIPNMPIASLDNSSLPISKSYLHGILTVTTMISKSNYKNPLLLLTSTH